ncbi:MAG: hypothetical protein ABSH20_29915, partial [Tepidisphaeraceae bacterium]
VASCWPGWTVRWHRDHFESQTAQTGGLLQFPMPPRSKLLKDIRTSLMYEDKSSMVDLIMRLTNEDRFALVNPHALREANLIVSKEERERIVDAAVASLGEEG